VSDRPRAPRARTRRYGVRRTALLAERLRFVSLRTYYGDVLSPGRLLPLLSRLYRASLRAGLLAVGLRARRHRTAFFHVCDRRLGARIARGPLRRHAFSRLRRIAGRRVAGRGCSGQRGSRPQAAGGNPGPRGRRTLFRRGLAIRLRTGFYVGVARHADGARGLFFGAPPWRPRNGALRAARAFELFFVRPCVAHASG